MAATALAVPAAANAATPVELGAGADVSLAVDAAGTAHVAWSQSGTPDVTRYCRVTDIAAATGCPGALSFPPVNAGNGLIGRSLVAVSGPTVVVLWRECCTPEQVNARVSGDSGTSFPTAVTLADVGADNPASTSADAVTDGSFVDWGDGVSFQRGALTGVPSTVRADLFGPVGFASASALRGTRPFWVGESDLKQLSFRQSLAGDVNDEANWTAPTPIPTSGTGFKRPALAFDSEIFLAYTDAAPGGTDRPQLRRYDAASDSFGEAVLVADQSATGIDIAVDGTGIIHVVWVNSGGSWWARSADRGASFSSPVRLTEEMGGITHVQVGAGADGSGSAGLRTVDGKVWIVPLEDTDAPELEVGAGRSARVSGAIRVGATCTEDCALRGSGSIGVRIRGRADRLAAKSKRLKLRPDTQTAAANQKRTLKLRLSRKVRKQVTKALAAGGRAKAKVKVRATDAGGNRTTERLAIRLKRR